MRLPHPSLLTRSLHPRQAAACGRWHLLPAPPLTRTPCPTEHLPGGCRRNTWIVPWSDAAHSRRGATPGGEKARQVMVAGVEPLRNSSALSSLRRTCGGRAQAPSGAAAGGLKSWAGGVAGSARCRALARTGGRRAPVWAGTGWQAGSSWTTSRQGAGHAAAQQPSALPGARGTRCLFWRRSPAAGPLHPTPSPSACFQSEFRIGE